jgi:Leucine-rich repeat (LRR) protein
MEIESLRNKLLQEYSTENLNRISAQLLFLYRNRQFSMLQKIAEILSEFVRIEIDETGRGFSKMMMLYHPDRGELHRNEISRLAGENNFEALLNYSHILRLGEIEELSAVIADFEDIDYSPVYEWDFDMGEYSVVTEDGVEGTGKKRRFSTKREQGISFYDAIKIRQFGHTRTGFPVCYLEDLEEIELSGMNIGDLDGVQYCIHTLSLDLSGNALDDISLLENLSQLEVLNLSGNRIEIIDPLANLFNLKELYISDNRIRDISVLFLSNKLEYADLTGNPVPFSQVTELRNSGVDVDF